jgi:hypothetical protein
MAGVTSGQVPGGAESRFVMADIGGVEGVGKCLE